MRLRLLLEHMREGHFLEIRIVKRLTPYRLAICFLTLAIGGCGSTNATQGSRFEPTTEQRRLMNAAFCYCLLACDSTFESILTEDGSLAGYIETSQFNFDDFEAVDLEAHDYLAENPVTSKHGDKLCVMRCMDFYNSDELADRVSSLSAARP